MHRDGSNDAWWFAGVMTFLFFCVLAVFFFATIEFNATPKTPEEIAEEECQAEEYRQSHTYHFPVVSVFRYIETSTNHYGAVTDQDICYSFIWLDADGMTHQTDSYENLDYGTQHIKVGEKDEFVVYDYCHSTTLFLSEDTLQSMNKT